LGEEAAALKEALSLSGERVVALEKENGDVRKMVGDLTTELDEMVNNTISSETQNPPKDYC
jgi:hypothetical protein